MKKKVLFGVGVIVVLAICLCVYLLSGAGSTYYYSQIDNSKIEQTESAGTMTLNRGTASLELLAEGLGGQEVSFDFGSVLKLHYRPETRAMQVMRKKWDAEGYDEKSINLARLDTLQVYLDQSTAELFVNQGEKVLTFKAYFGRDTGVKIGSEKKSGCQLGYWRYHNGTDSGLSIGGPPDY